MYKKIPCRHYGEDGRLLTPCIQGDNCRFIHPTDTKWPQATDSKANNKSYRVVPLESQSDLFLRRSKTEFSNRRHERRTQSYSRDFDASETRYNSRSRSKDNSRDRSKGSVDSENRNTRSIHNDKNVKAVEEGSKSISWSVKQTLTGLQEVTEPSQTDENYLIADKLASRQSIDTALAHDHGPGKIAHLLQKLASLSRESDQLCEVQRKEEQKIESYRKISSTLKNISASAEDVVAPQLARSMVMQRDCQSLIEKNDMDCRTIWGDMINILSEETKRAIDQHLHLALTSMKNETMRGISKIEDASKKRKRVVIEDSIDPQPRDDRDNDMRIAHGEEFPSVNNGAFQTSKRQRIGAPSLSISEPKRKQDPEDNELEQGSMIEQLRLKIKRQEEIIASLTKVNKTLQAKYEDCEEKLARIGGCLGRDSL